MATAVVQSGRPKTSLVWDYFKYHVTLGKTVCQVDVNGKHCEATFKRKFSTNLKGHPKSKYGEEYELLQKKEITRKNEHWQIPKSYNIILRGSKQSLRSCKKQRSIISKIHNTSTSLGNCLFLLQPQAHLIVL